MNRKQYVIETVKRMHSDGLNYSDIGRNIDVWPADVWKAINEDYVSPALMKAIFPPRKRSRFTADVDRETIERLDELLARYGVTRTWLIERCVEWMDAGNITATRNAAQQDQSAQSTRQ